jgi:MFS transporter, ACS family, glucarate transporter
MPRTRVRYGVLTLLCFLAMITYMDRAMYGSAKADLMAAVGQPVSKFFYVLTAFQLAYALFEIPVGWMGDRYGPRVTLLRIVVWWSVFVALTGFTGLKVPGLEIVPIGFTVLIVMQFLFGIGEAGAFPNMSKAVYNWFPASERGFAKGTIWMAARLMGGLTPMVWVLLVELGGLSWRQALWLFAGVAAVWCMVFYFVFRNTPGDHPGVSAAELDHINRDRIADDRRGPTPWRRIFLNRNVAALCVMYMVTNFNWYFLMYYLPGTLKKQFPEWDTFDGGKIGLAILGGAPLLVGMFGCYLGGVLSDRTIRRTGDRRWGRRVVPMFGYGLAGVCYMLAAAFTDNLLLFAGCLILVGFFNDLIMGPSWAVSQDIGRRYSAVVGGTMNMVGNLGAALGNFITGLILEQHTVDGTVGTAGYVTCFLMFGFVYMLGVIAWLFIDASKPIDADTDSHSLTNDSTQT